MKTYIKNIGFIALGAFLVTGVTVFATTWRGTDSIQQNTIIEPSVISQNFDYLYERVKELESNSLNADELQFRPANVGEDEYGAWSAKFAGTTRWWGRDTHPDDTCNKRHRTAYTCPVGVSKKCNDIMQVSGINDWKRRTITCKKAAVPYMLLD